MKKNVGFAILGAIGLGLCTFAIAHTHPGLLGNHHDAIPFHSDPAVAAEHIAQVYPLIAPYDINKDGQLDKNELEAFGAAIASGTVQFPAHHSPPPALAEHPEMMLHHIADVYAQVGQYDANKDGTLDGNEQAKLKAGIESGSVNLHRSLPSHGSHNMTSVHD